MCVMKTYLTQTRIAVLAFLMGACLTAAAQPTPGISYQAVARDGGGLYTNQALTVRFTILETADMLPVYAETHSAVTNQYGLFTLTIGQGTPVQGSFVNIDWSIGFHMLQVEIDKGAGFELMGTNILDRVPYSFYADKAGAVDSVFLSLNDLLDVDALAPVVDEVLKWNGSQWAPANDNVASGGGAVNTSPRISGDGTIANPLDIASQNAMPDQVLKWNGSAFAPASDEVDDADHDPTNEIETWATLAGIPADFADGTDDVDDADHDPTNEIQSLALSGVNLSLSNGGGSVTLPTGTTYSAGTGISISGNVISNADPDQTVSLTGSGATTISGTYPNFTISSTDNVDDADHDPFNEIETWTTLAGIPSGFVDGVDDVNDGDHDPTNEIETWSTLAGIPTDFADGTDDVDDADNDPTNEVQTLSLSGTSLSLSNGGGSVTLPTGTTYSAGTGISISGNVISNADPDQTVSLTGSGATTISGTYPNFTVSSTDNVDDADNDPTNEIETWATLSGIPGGFADGVDNINDADHDPSNEVETWATLAGIPAGFVDGVDDVNDGDTNPTNEIQTLSYSGNQLTLSNGGGSATLKQGLWDASGTNVYYNVGRVGIGTSSLDPEASLHLLLPNSGNFAHLQIESPATNQGFGMVFSQPNEDWYMGQNVGNWSDNRFQIAPGSSNHWLTILPNGNVGLTRTGFTTPLARFQVPQNGDMDNGGSLDVYQAAIYVGENINTGIALDHDQIESKGTALKVNHLTDQDVLLTLSNGSAGISGGNVGIGVSTAAADFHVAEGRTILFGHDTLGKSNYHPDPKVMFLPGKGGAFRAGQLNADGSIIGGTGWNFWDWNKVGWASVAIGSNTRAMGAGSVAIGIRSDARNFGSVALGHLSRTLGNSAVAAGYYTRADAFVSTAVGAGNVGGGSANSWFSLDPIFEVGNSTDTTNRSNAFTVLKNGRVAINHHNPQAMLDIEQPNPGPGNGVFLNLAGIGHWETMVDNSADYNFYFNNVLKGYIRDTDGVYMTNSDQRLKTNIEPITGVLSNVRQLQAQRYHFRDNAPGAEFSIGFLAQDVEPLFPDLVSEKEGIMGLNYDGFSVIAIQAIREQQELIDNQAEMIESLQKEMEALKRRVSAMEK
jgi:hypothetical protein